MRVWDKERRVSISGTQSPVVTDFIKSAGEGLGKGGFMNRSASVSLASYADVLRLVITRSSAWEASASLVHDKSHKVTWLNKSKGLSLPVFKPRGTRYESVN